MHAGIDFDTNAVHVVLLPEEEGKAQYLLYGLKGHDAFERTRAVREALPARGWWRDQGVISVCIEEPMQRGPAAVTFIPKLKAIQGAVLACLPTSLLVHPLRAGEWKKQVGLSGNASKEDVRYFAAGHANWSVALPQDAFDAYCLALCAEQLTVSAPA